MSSFKPIQNYDGLSPQTTKGDLAVFGSVGSSRLAIGSDGTVATADSTQTLGIRWGTIPGGNLNVATLTGATTLTIANDIVEVSGTTFVVTLPNAVGNSGKQISIIKTDTGLLTPISVIGITTTQVVGITLNTFQERIDFYSNNVTWNIRQHSWNTDWVDAGGITISGTTANPVKPTMTLDRIKYRRDGRDGIFNLAYVQAAISATAGTGDYLFSIPFPLVANMSLLVGYSPTIGNAAPWRPSNIIGHGIASVGADSGGVELALYGATQFRGFAVTSSQQALFCATSNFALSGSTLTYNFEIRIPIQGWTP